ncbi:hypothetical protein PS918_03179 [Pseudomonas fluorescens]|uniref:Uncharacterized protein n=1 Tax=Pseudomonas fluorescens TaxID=294 RepID=A0A5E7SU87_PSEFL|nr:hypothetical protein [Pseudomonas fluorescens]VVP90421.1 hypothetical protein PS918_03179 [Pseudomonas fluorescens]
MSTLNEIAANHARMAREKQEEATGLSERQLQIVGGFEISCPENPQQVPLHLVAGVQENLVGQAAGF